MIRRLLMDFLADGGEIMYSDASLYQEFLKWKQDNERAQAERDRQQRLRQAERTRREDFIRNQRIDSTLMDGVSKGESWMQFMRRTAAPSDLQKRYTELQERSGIKPGSTGEDLFEKGFRMGE